MFKFAIVVLLARFCDEESRPECVCGPISSFSKNECLDWRHTTIGIE